MILLHLLPSVLPMIGFSAVNNTRLSTMNSSGLTPPLTTNSPKP